VKLTAFALQLAVALAPAPALAQAPLRAVIVVRHAEKTSAPKENPPLSPAGKDRAQALLETLRDAGITTIVTTDQQRTRLTAAPLAEVLHLQAQIVPRTEKPEDDAVAIGSLVRKAGGTVLVVSHQLTIPRIIAVLGGPQVATVCDVEFSNLYVLLPVGNERQLRLVRGHFGAPDPPHGSDCHISPTSPP
jgi:broad specificity phosphatase PhoE